MGDRGNIAIQQPSDGATARVYLYSHWGGSELPSVLQTALARKVRWDDPAYLARIIFDAMTEGEQGEETGYGISTFISDNEHPILVVDCGTQTITVEGGPADVKWTFAEFIALEDPNTIVNALDS